MGKSNTCNLREDESLTEELRKYTCLYDKAEKEHKERDRTKKAWQAIIIALGCEEVKINGFKLKFIHTHHQII